VQEANDDRVRQKHPHAHLTLEGHEDVDGICNNLPLEARQCGQESECVEEREREREREKRRRRQAKSLRIALVRLECMSQ